NHFTSLLSTQRTASKIFPYTTLFRSKTPLNAGRQKPRKKHQHRRHARECAKNSWPAQNANPQKSRAPSASIMTFGTAPTVPHHLDRKSTRLNSSHVSISYAVFCLKKK